MDAPILFGEMMANKAGKGANFERQFCGSLSRWWTDGIRDDAFWRTSQSGGRATIRQRKGQSTSGHNGDISATDDCGRPFLKVVTLECKRGYNRATIADLLDKPETAAKQTYEEWMDKAQEEAKKADSLSWMLVHKRDRREAIVVTPTSWLLDYTASEADLIMENAATYWFSGPLHGEEVAILPLALFFQLVVPAKVLKIGNKLLEWSKT